MLSFIIAYSPDTDERIINKRLVVSYYKELFPTAEFIIEEVRTQDIFNKCKAYNSGAIKAKNSILAFIDIDIIVSKSSICKCIEVCQSSDNIVIGYNGVAIYLTYEAKKQLPHRIDYDTISNTLLIEKYKFNNLFKTNMFEVGNLRAVGGCLVMNKQCFNDIRGFNPNFFGWGYEDNEIIIRAHKLGKKIFYANTKAPYLYHLPHYDKSVNKSQHTNYMNNQKEYERVCKMSNEDLNQYINTWTL